MIGTMLASVLGKTRDNRLSTRQFPRCRLTKIFVLVISSPPAHILVALCPYTVEIGIAFLYREGGNHRKDGGQREQP